MEKQIKFETALDELEEITDKLSQSGTTLDESLKLYKRGIELIRICTEKLEKAEQTVKVIRQKDGQATEENFNG